MLALIHVDLISESHSIRNGTPLNQSTSTKIGCNFIHLQLACIKLISKQDYLLDFKIKGMNLISFLLVCVRYTKINRRAWFTHMLIQCSDMPVTCFKVLQRNKSISLFHYLWLIRKNNRNCFFFISNLSRWYDWYNKFRLKKNLVIRFILDS